MPTIEVYTKVLVEVDYDMIPREPDVGVGGVSVNAVRRDGQLLQLNEQEMNRLMEKVEQVEADDEYGP